VGGRGRNDTNNVSTYEYMNKEKSIKNVSDAIRFDRIIQLITLKS
jgi:hypothetical protein